MLQKYHHHAPPFLIAEARLAAIYGELDAKCCFSSRITMIAIDKNGYHIGTEKLKCWRFFTWSTPA